MPNAAKAKGSRWERAVVLALAAIFRGLFGLEPRRAVQNGPSDDGDIHGIGPFVGQAKDWRSWEAAIREGLDGAVRQARVAGVPYGVAFVKRARRPASEGYAVMTVGTWARFLLRLRRAETYLARSDEAAYLRHLEETREDNARADGSPEAD